LVGLYILNATILDADKNNIDYLIKGCWTSKGFTPIRRDSPYAKILNRKLLLEDVYSTYYCLGILILMGRDIGPYSEGILGNFKSWFQSTGWIYNADWTETIIERRLDIELIQQALMGLKLGLLLGTEHRDLPYDEQRLSNLLGYIEKPRYMTSLYHAVLCLKLMQQWDKSKEKYNDVIASYVISHFEENEKGFREYQFGDVKIFNYRGMEDGAKGATAKHRFQSDYITSSINATTYSLWLGIEGVRNKLLDFLKLKGKLIVQFFDDQKCVDGGYGTPIKIAKYTATFGPDVTSIETCNHIMGSSLASIL
jgi:hypothetical protein